MDFGEFLGSIQPVDLLLFLYFAGFFVLGFAQGTIRRLIGIGSVLFSFFLAANVAAPLGEFLGANWTQFPREYSYMIGFLTVFVAASVAFALVAQGFYKTQPLFENARWVDEILGGILGLIQAGIILGAFIVILGSFFLLPTIPESPNEIEFLRGIWEALEPSAIAGFFEDVAIPGFFVLFGFLVPDDIETLFPGTSA